MIEKPKNPPTNLAVTGIYFLTPVIFDVIKKLKPSWFFFVHQFKYFNFNLNIYLVCLFPTK